MDLSFTMGCIEYRFGYEKSMEYIRNAGFCATDYSLDSMVQDASPWNGAQWRAHAEAVRACADRLGIRINQTHAPFSFSHRLWKDETSYRDIILPRILRALEISGILGAKVAVVHPIHHDVYQGHEEEMFVRNMDFYRMLIPYAREYRVKIGLENMYQVDARRKCIVDDTCSRSEEFIRYIDTVDSEWVVACLDLGHVGLIQRKDEAWDMIRALGHNRLQSLHVHDNDYRGDQHTIPYLGTMNWEEITRALGEIDYQGDFTYEAGWSFLQRVDDEFLPVSMRYMYDLGQHLMEKINRSRPQKEN